MVITDIAYNESHFTVFLTDIEKHVPLCRLIFSGTQRITSSFRTCQNKEVPACLALAEGWFIENQFFHIFLCIFLKIRNTLFYRETESIP